jgi:hypothetical protein
MATERQHQLDLVIDTKRAHWQIIQDILVLFKSAPIYSNGKYKIITDRDDLPVRQVFHAGNILGRAEVRVAQDPAAINQITAEFANRNLGYERDVYVLQDSASIFGSNEPIKNSDTSLIGITRPTEVARRLDFEMQRRQQEIREFTFATGLEAVAVEPGDHCIVGLLMTDFELGVGGRVLDGTSSHFISDREVTLNSGSTYDLWLWHSAADTPEYRTITGSATQIRIQPTSGFNFRASSGDRFAIGVQSEELALAVVKKVTHDENGTIQIVADEYVPISIRQDCPDSLFAQVLNLAPSQPNGSAIFTGSDCSACFRFTYVSCQGGTTRGITSNAAFNASSGNGGNTAAVLAHTAHPPVQSILVGNTISFVTGQASGQVTYIISYYAIGSPGLQGLATYASLVGNARVESGDAYYVTFNTSASGFRIEVSTNGTSMSPIGSFYGNSGCAQVSGVGSFVYARAVPFNAGGIANTTGTWVFSMDTAGCFAIDQGPPTTTTSFVTQSLSTLLAASIPGSILSVNQSVQMRAIGLVNESCVASEVTEASFAVTYVGTTVVNSLVINLRTAGNSGVGADARRRVPCA